ncbi:tRNA glutamyl-Q(34) synthetase GluQRS [Thiothrix nivea]|uniref:Glutamyl-Q tRNA(Asp) synthetase n=1 Tax=Thiothrix nivea (strain ATCC 35100 / DSM 5205 / JP2) TaxID=870187 RepID=A0A656H8U9_THINJ|nr:tRNA glutamyl-Q(34) synthetase GluQRS [Thiothrix nivea]EIJ32798.1 Glutamyl-Q tRNA(Asp) synthetase [Thiothrix nivea DSM 5205]
MPVIGRFAPSPTGPLHFGSLVAATASYLAARQAGGKWLLRIEDIDKPREQSGAADSIIHTLTAYGFGWDGDILYQSQRLDAYHEALASLHGHTYPCTCSRKDIQAHGHMGAFGTVYPGTCRGKLAPNHSSQHAIRLRTHDEPICFTDRIQGEYCQRLESELGDFVILRADGLFAYQLAVVVDDAFQGVNQVVRGADLLDNTPRQIWLQQLLGFPRPDYVHVPLVLNASGQKLSKQNLAPAIRTTDRLQRLVASLRFLGQPCPEMGAFANLTAFWDWAIANWDMTKISKTQVWA